MIKRIRSLTKNNDVKKLSVNFLSLFSVQGLNILLPLLTLPYLFRVLGADKFGLIAFAFLTIIFFRVFVDYGFQLYATREISKHRDDKKKLSEIYSTVLSSKILLILISFLILNILIFFFDNFSNEYILFFFTFIFFTGEAIFPVWFFQGIEDMRYIGYLNLFAKIFFTLGMIFIGIYLINIKYKIKFKLQPISKIKNVLKDNWNIFITQLMPNLYNNFSTFLLGFFASMENLGFYSLAIKIMNIANSIITIFRNVTFPHLVKNYSKFNKITKVMIISSLIMTVGIFSTTNLILPLIFGEKVYSSIVLIYILAISPILHPITSSFGANKLLILKKDKEYKDIVLKFSLVGFIGAWIMIPYGIVGEVINIVLTRAIISFFVYMKAKEFNNLFSIDSNIKYKKAI